MNRQLLLVFAHLGKALERGLRKAIRGAQWRQRVRELMMVLYVGARSRVTADNGTHEDFVFGVGEQRRAGVSLSLHR